MNKITIILIVLILATGCRTTKKVTETKAVTTNKTEVAQKSDTKEKVKVDADKTTYKKTTITKTEYFAPSKPTEEPNGSKPTVAPIEPESVVKVTETTIIEEGTEDKTKTETIKTDNSEISTETEGKSKVESTVTEKKKVPVQWWAIFGILIIVAVGAVYLKISGGWRIAETFLSKIFGK